MSIFFMIVLGIFLIPGHVYSDSSSDYDTGGWQHGSLFSAPNWLLDMYGDDTDTMSEYMDYTGYEVRQAANNKTTTTYNDYLDQGWGYLQGGNNKDAMTAFESALELNPASGDAYYGKGLALENQKRYLSAVDAYEKAISNKMKVMDTWQAYSGLGRCYIAVQQYDKAEDALTKALSLYKATDANDSEELASIKEGLEKANSMTGSSSDTNVS